MLANRPVLFVIPPFIQMNTPYPSTMYLKGFLNTKQVSSYQMDLSLEVILALFSTEGLTHLFIESEKYKQKLSDNAKRIYTLRNRYIQTITSVIRFLQGKNDSLVPLLCDPGYLPEAGRFSESEEDMEWAFGSMGTRDKARYLTTLYLEDLSDFITETVDPDFGFSRYAEQMGRCASSFNTLYAALAKPVSFIDSYLIKLFDKKIKETNPSLIALSVPFPGNLYSALRCAQWVKKEYPDIPIAMGGGFINTELRSVTDIRLFEFIDYLLLDDGEDPLFQLIQYINGDVPLSDLVRTFTLSPDKKQILYYNNLSIPHTKQTETGTPDYSDLLLSEYISVIEVVNPMHKLWSDGRWNKLTLAHGCYWGKCSFCDGSLDYIGRYEPNTATILADRMEQMIAQTGENGFHFVDEAAPPVLLKELALEILKRGLQVVWWGNIRFERSYTADLCYLLKASGCIAVSGGLEVASERLLKLINKGVNLEQVAHVTNHFTQAGIMVHAYLMYGFPTETAQETIDSLEVVRQLFEQELIQSGFWHRFAMTAHSPAGLHPEKFCTRITEPSFKGFAHNDLQFEDTKGCNHEVFSDGLRTSLFNYMHGIGLDYPLHKWFKTKVPRTTLPPNFIKRLLNESEQPEKQLARQLYWVGNSPELFSYGKGAFSIVRINTNTEELELELPTENAVFIYELLNLLSKSTVTLSEVKEMFKEKESGDFFRFWLSEEIACLRENGLLLL